MPVSFRAWRRIFAGAARHRRSRGALSRGATLTNLARIRKDSTPSLYPKGENRALSLGTLSKKYRGSQQSSEQRFQELVVVA